MRLRLPHRLNKTKCQQRWLDLLSHVRTHEGMILAVIDADRLLEDVLKKRGYKGKTVGERLVAAQKILSDNDSAWYAHKLRNRLVHEPEIRLKKDEAKNALAGFKQALHDLGAL